MKAYVPMMLRELPDALPDLDSCIGWLPVFESFDAAQKYSGPEAVETVDLFDDEELRQ